MAQLVPDIIRLCRAYLDAVLVKAVRDAEATRGEDELHGDGAVRQVMT